MLVLEKPFLVNEIASIKDIDIIQAIQSKKPSEILSLIEPAIQTHLLRDDFKLDTASFGYVSRNPTPKYVCCVATCVMAYSVGTTYPELAENAYLKDSLRRSGSLSFLFKSEDLNTLQNTLDWVRLGFVSTLLTYLNVDIDFSSTKFDGYISFDNDLPLQSSISSLNRVIEGLIRSDM